MDSLHSLETILHSLQQTYLRPLIHTTQNYKTAGMDIHHCVQYITNIPPSVLTGDVNAHSTLWHSCTDDHRGQLIANVISNSDHITLNTNTPTIVPNTTLQQHHHQISPRCLTHCITGHREQLNTHYNHTTYPSSPQFTYDMITDYNKTDGLSPSTRKLTGHNSRKTHHTHQHTHCQHNVYKYHTDGRQAQHTKGQDA